MKCFSCNKKAEIKLSYTDRQYCNSCFLRLIESRVRKELRKDKIIKAKETLFIINDRSKEYYITKYFLKRIFGNYLSVKDLKDKGRTTNNKIIIPWNMDRELSARLREYFSNKAPNIRKNQVYLLKCVIDEELMIVARILGITGKKEPYDEFIEKIEKKYPGIKFSLYQSFEHLKSGNILEKKH